MVAPLEDKIFPFPNKKWLPMGLHVLPVCMADGLQVHMEEIQERK